MAGDLTLPIRLAAAAVLAAAIGSAGPACAAPEIADPTMPAGPAAPARARGESAADTAPAPRWPELQAVQISARGDSTALIDGRVVRLGERVGALTLVAVDAQGVLLRGVRFEQRLSLLPGIAKTPPAGTAPGGDPNLNLAAKETR